MKLVKLSLVLTALLTAAACSVDATNGNDGKDGTAGKNGANGQDGEPGASETGEPTVSIVTPSKGILDREVEVSIGGNGTTFEANAKPSFGAGIEVTEVTHSSTSLITAKLKIAKDAQIGLRTVTVGSLKAEKAFAVMPAISVFGPDGKAAKVEQGGLVQFGIENNDSRAFDKDAWALNVGDLIDLGSQASGAQAGVGFLLAAPLTKPGTNQVFAANLDADGKPKVSFYGASDSLTVTARAAVPFTPGAGTEEAFASQTDTKLFKLTSPASEAGIVDYRIEVPADGVSVPVAFVFGTTGAKDDRLGQVLPGRNPFTGEFNPPPYDLHVAMPLPSGAAATDQYVVLANLGVKTGAKAKITATRSPAAVVAEATDPHTPVAPQVVGAVSATTAQMVTAELKAATEQDAYKFTVGAADILQISGSSDAADLEVIITKDPTVLADPPNTPAANRKVVTKIFPAKQLASQRVVPAVGVTDLFAVVQPYAQGTTKTGKYTLGIRKMP